MTDRAIACLISSNFEATAKFYRYFGFETVSKDDAAMRLARGPVELMFMMHSGPLPRDEDRIWANHHQSRVCTATKHTRESAQKRPIPEVRSRNYLIIPID